MANGQHTKMSAENAKLWFAILGIASWVAIQSMLHFADGTRHETQEQKSNRIRRIVSEEMTENVPPPEVKAQLRRLESEVARLKEKLK